MRNEAFRYPGYIKITIFGFALTALWGSLHTIILPVRLLDFVAEPEKNTYLGLLTFAGLLLGMAVQPIVGTLSDRSRSARGRRRPYILLGSVCLLILLPGISVLASYAGIFLIYCLLQLSSNTAQGGYQALIPDLVPEARRGLASGVKSLLEILGGVALLYPVALFMDRHAAGDAGPWLGLSLGVPALILMGAVAATMLTVREQPGGGRQQPLLATLRQCFRINVRANRDFVWFLLSRLLIFLAFIAVQTFALYFLRDVVGVTDPAAATAKFSLTAVAGMLAAVYPAGYLSDRVGRRPIIIGSGLLGGGAVVLILFFQHSYPLILGCAGFLGVSFGAFMSTNWALATDLIVRGEEARYLGLTNLATAGGSALARLIGPLIDLFNRYGDGLGYSVMLAICAASLIAGSLLVLKIKTPRLA